MASTSHQLLVIEGVSVPKRLTIKGIAGDEPIHNGEAESLKELVESAVKAGVDLSLADLRGVDLSFLDLSNAKLNGADL